MEQTKWDKLVKQFYNEIKTDFISCAGWYYKSDGLWIKKDAYIQLEKRFRKWKTGKGFRRLVDRFLFLDDVKRLLKRDCNCRHVWAGQRASRWLRDYMKNSGVWVK